MIYMIILLMRSWWKTVRLSADIERTTSNFLFLCVKDKSKHELAQKTSCILVSSVSINDNIVFLYVQYQTDQTFYLISRKYSLEPVKV